MEHNPVLGPRVLELLLNHFCNYYQSNESVLPPIDLKKTVLIQDMDVTLQVMHLQLITIFVSKQGRKSFPQ